MTRALHRAASVGAGLLVAALALTLAGSAAPAVAAWAFRTLVDELPRSDRWPDVLPHVALVAVSGALAVLLPTAADTLLRRLAGRMRVREHDDLYRSVNGIEDLVRFDDPEFHADLALAREQGIDASGEVVGGAARTLQSVATSLGFVTALLAVYPLLLVAAVLASLPVVVVERSLGRVRLATVRELNAHSRERFLYAQAMAGHREAKEVRLLDIGGFLRRRAHERFVSAVDAEHRLARRELAMSTVSVLVGLVFSAATLVWASARFHQGLLSLGDLTVVAAAGAGIVQGLSGSVANVGRLRHSLDLQRSLTRLVERVGAPEAGPTEVVPPLAAAIELRDVAFRYPGQDRPTVQDVRFRIGADQVVAMVGPNGAGKSTLAKLVCRLYDPSSGAVLWDGVDLRKYSHASLRRRLGVLFQDFVIYELPVEENIAIGRIERLGSPEAVREAAALAGAAAIIERLPRGYATRLTRMYPDPDDETATGVVLSGGQGQRVTIARLLMRADADLLVLDEPTSGLDPDAEAELLATLRRSRAGKATLFITHRLGAARAADHILVVDGGRLVEQGSHQELMAAAGTYARLYRLQAAGYGPGDTADHG